MIPLPVDPEIPRIRDALAREGALVLVAPPGAGKTTRVPPSLLDSRGRVVLVQPRRVAAVSIARRIAFERGEEVGGSVGYQIRFDRRVTRATRLVVLTEGVLLRRLQRNPFLEGVSCVVLDEFHERSLASDLLLALLRDVRGGARSDLRIVVMSATLEAEPVAGFLGGCPVIEIPGRPHPVTILHEAQGPGEALARRVARAVRIHAGTTTGHLLVFLPGLREIRAVARELEPWADGEGFALHPLHGSLPLDAQESVLRPSPGRKVILSTNVAETSLTVSGVDLVIDAGLQRVLRNDPRHGLDRLVTERASRHSLEQRAGRAGREGPGIAVRLFGKADEARLPLSLPPEILRVDLARTVLELRAWGIARPQDFAFLTAPPLPSWQGAEVLLTRLGALEKEGGPLTPTGEALCRLPCHPRIGRLLLEGRTRGVLQEAAVIAALLEERDVVRREEHGPPTPTVTGPSDLLHRLDLLGRAPRDDGIGRPDLALPSLDRGAVRVVRRTSEKLLAEARSLEAGDAKTKTTRPAPASRDEHLLRSLLAAFPDRVARRREMGSARGRMVGGRGVVLLPSSVVRDGELFLAIVADESVRGERLEARVRLASRIERGWIEEDLASLVEERDEVVFDAATGKVRAFRALHYLDLPLEDPREVRPDRAQAEVLLASALPGVVPDLVGKDPALASFLVRSRCLAAWMPELELPDLSTTALAGLLRPFCAGMRSLHDLTKQGILTLVKRSLSSRQLAALDLQAPETIEVPTGSRIRLVYEEGKPPVLAVRLQEMFGCATTPRVAAGRVPVVLHLLGPNFRPVQVTQDLESFWSSTYAQVKKDLRGRYPKHAWPEDPLAASPVRGAKKRKS